MLTFHLNKIGFIKKEIIGNKRKGWIKNCIEKIESWKQLYQMAAHGNF